jgi:hypothetical protein
MYTAQLIGTTFKRKEGNKIVTYKRGSRISFESINEIPAGFRDLFVTLAQDELPEEYAGEDNKAAGLKIVQTSPNGWYDIINTKTGKAINNRRLRIDEARSLASVYSCYDNGEEGEAATDEIVHNENPLAITFGKESPTLDTVVFKDDAKK